MPGIIDCITKVGLSEADSKLITAAYNKYKQDGMDDLSAGLKATSDFHKALFNETNQLRKQIKLPSEKYVPFDNSKKVSEINNRYDKIAKGEPVPTPYVSKSGNQKLIYDNGVAKVIDTKTGEEVSRATYRKVIDEAADQYDFTKGKRAEINDNIPDPKQYNQEVLSKTTNPVEVAEVFINEMPEVPALSSQDQAIAEFGNFKIKESSYAMFGDRNNINNAKARTYFSKDGQSIDQIAKEISDHYGLEVWVQDIVDFMDRFPNGTDSALKAKESAISLQARKRFEELTGLPLDQKIAEKAIDQEVAKLNEAAQAELNIINEQDYVNREQDEQNFWAKQIEEDSAVPEVEPAAKLNDQSGDTGKENPSPGKDNRPPEAGQPIPPETSRPEQPEVTDNKVKKTIVTKRAYEGEFRNEVKSELEKIGLYREIESHTEAKAKAKQLIDKFGEDTALEAVRNNDVPDGAGAYIWNTVIESVDKKILTETDATKLSELFIHQANLLEELDVQARSKGRFNSALADIYENSDLGYNLGKKIQEYKDINNGVIPPEIEAKFQDLDTQLKAVKKRIAEAEEKAKAAEENLAILNIQENIARKKEADGKKTYAKKAKEVADQFRKLKTKPLTFKDKNGNPIPVQLQGLGWNDIVELGAKAIEKTGQLIDGIKAISDKLSEMKWFNDLDEDNKAAVLKQVEDYFKEPDATTPGRIKIPHSMIREAVEAGADNIETLTKVIKEQIKAEYPNATDREVRDGITSYGKTVNPNREAIELEIRKMKRIGRAVSAMEDIAQKKRPLRSGLQRDKLDAEERALQKEVREAMKYLPLDEETSNLQLKTALDAAKTRARNRIEELQKEIDSKERTQRNYKIIEPDEELVQLKAEKDRLQKDHDEIFGEKSLTEEKRLENAIVATQRSLEEYERKIKERELSPKKPIGVKSNRLLDELRAKRDEAKKEFRKLQEDAGIIEQKKLESAKKRARTRIEELQKRIDEKDFSKKVVTPIVADTELIKLKAEKLRVQEEYDKEFYKHKLANRTFWEKKKDQLWAGWGLTRAITATAEFSFVLIQGGSLTVSNMLHKPEAVGRAFKNMWESMRSEKKSAQWLNEIKSQDWYLLAKESKLAITEPKAEMLAREETFFSGWTDLIWNTLGQPLRLKSKEAYQKWRSRNPFRGLERAATAYLDTLRIERYFDGVAMLDIKKQDGKEVTKQDYKDIADVANTLTGRASLGIGEAHTELLTKIFFSPRLWASTFKTATPYGLYHFGKMTPTARKMVIMDMARFLGVTTGLVMSAAAVYNNDDDEETSVEFDPRSSDFMKIKLGNTRVDPFGGRVQQIVLTTRLMLGAIGEDAYKNAKGEVHKLGVQYKSPTLFETAMRMATNKLSPSSSFVYEWSTTKLKKDKETGVEKRVDMYGEDFEVGKELQERLMPIYFQAIGELSKDEKNSESLNAFLLFYAFFGGGVQTYKEKKKKE